MVSSSPQSIASLLGAQTLQTRLYRGVETADEERAGSGGSLPDLETIGEMIMATTKRRQRSNVTEAANATEQGTRRLNVQVNDEAYQRLMLHAIMRRQSPGELVSFLIDQHLREFRVQKNPTTRGTATESASCEDQASESVPAVAA